MRTRSKPECDLGGEKDFAEVENGRLVASLERILRPYLEKGPGSGRIETQEAAIVESAASDLTDLLRWERQYDRAILMQHRLSQILPDQSQKFRIVAATLAIESGAVEPGLNELRTEIETMDPAEGRFLMASTLLWLQQYEHASRLLSDTISDDNESTADRAEAAYALFQVLGLLGKLPQAIEAWNTAASLDIRYASTLSELVRVQIYWRDFDGALKTVAGDPSEIRRSFYRDLVAARTRPLFGRERWDWVADHGPSSIAEAPEEFSDAALRNISPQLALNVLVPFINRRDLSPRRLVLTGLAWAQQREIARARWALQLALRLADLERPRRTRQGAENTRIFDAETRIAYGEIPVDGDVRASLDQFFIPTASPTNRLAPLGVTTTA